VKAHDAFLRCAEAQQIDASVPDGVSIYDCIFLMDSFAADDFYLEFAQHTDRYSTSSTRGDRKRIWCAGDHCCFHVPLFVLLQCCFYPAHTFYGNIWADDQNRFLCLSNILQESLLECDLIIDDITAERCILLICSNAVTDVGVAFIVCIVWKCSHSWTGNPLQKADRFAKERHISWGSGRLPLQLDFRQVVIARMPHDSFILYICSPMGIPRLLVAVHFFVRQPEQVGTGGIEML